MSRAGAARGGRKDMAVGVADDLVKAEVDDIEARTLWRGDHLVAVRSLLPWQIGAGALVAPRPLGAEPPLRGKGDLSCAAAEVVRPIGALRIWSEGYMAGLAAQLKRVQWRQLRLLHPEGGQARGGRGDEQLALG